MFDYWQTQTSKPLFSDLLWSRPEQKSLAGKLGFIGGSKSAFASISFAEQAATETGIGSTKILAPDSLRSILKSLPNINFADSNTSGGFARAALPFWLALAAETDASLLTGDFGKNPETVSLINDYLLQVDSTKPIILTRDAVDLATNNLATVASQANMIAVLSFSQLQKLFRKVLYPVVLVHSIQVAKLVEALHKFTITYPLTLVVFHESQLHIAQAGQVVSTKFTKPTDIWQGKTAAQIATWAAWSPAKLFESTVTSVYNGTDRSEN